MNIFEVAAKLTMDAKDFIKGLKDAQNGMNNSKKSLEQYRKDVIALAQQYKNSGMSMSEAMKKAYSEIDKSLYNLGKDADSSGTKIKTFGDFFGTLKEKATSAFSGIKNITESTGNSVSVFGDVLKANLASDIIQKSAEGIVSAFQKISSAATGFVKDSVSVGENFDSAMSQVYATMGDKASEVVEYNGEMLQSTEALRKFAKEMGATTKYSATESAQALNYMALAGYNAETSMKMLPNVMNLASAGAFDLARASDMLTDTQTAFGMSIERTEQMVDEMAAAASNSNTSVAQLGDAFLTVGGLAKELNGGFVTLSNGTTTTVDGIQELEIALGAMANAGIKGSEAGTHMRNLLMKLSSPTEDATKLFEELGVSVFDDAGNMKSLKDVFEELNRAFNDMGNQQQKLQAISEIFNARDTASATALLSAVEQSWDSLGEAILNAEGAAAKMAETQLNNLAGAKTIMKSALEGLQINISDAVNPFITPFVKFAGESLQAFSNTIEKEGIENLRGTISEVVTNAGVLIYKNVPKFLKNLVKVLTIIKNGIADGIPSFMDYMRSAIATIAQDMGKDLPEFIKAGQRITSEIGKGITRNSTYIVRAISEIAKSISKSISQNLPVIIPAITSGVLTITNELTKPKMISEFVDSGIDLLTGLATGLAESTSVLIERVPDIVENLKQGFSDNKDKIKGAGETILSAFTDEFGEFSFSGAVDSLISNFSKAIESKEWKDVTDKISKGIQKIDFAEVTSNLSKLIIGITDSTGKLVDGIDWSVIGNAIGEAMNGIDWYAILGKALNLAETTLQQAPELLKGIADGLDKGTAAQLAALGLNLLTGKAFVDAIAVSLSSATALTTISAAVSNVVLPAIGAAVVGWNLGSVIYNAHKDSIDETLASIVDSFKDAGYQIKAIWDWTFNNKSGLSYQQIYKNIALDETASGVGFQSDKYRQMVADWGNEEIYETFGNGNGINFNAFEDSVKQKLDTVKWLMNDTANSEEIKTAGKTLADNFGAGIAESAKGAESMEELIKSVKKAAGIDTEGLQTEMKTSGENMSKMFADGIKNNSYQVENAVGGITQEISDNLEHHSPAKKGLLANDDTWMPNMMQMFADGIKDNIYLISEQISNLGGDISSAIRFTIDSAVSWGSDMIDNFISGISQKWNDAVNAVSGFADMIASYIGFSEPEKGALSDFHTFAPDMMQLFAKGIKENQSLVLSQAETLSDNLADTFQNPFKINVDSGFNDFVLPELSVLPALTSEINFKPYTVPEIDIPDLSVTADTNKLSDNLADTFRNPFTIEFSETKMPELPEIPDLISNIKFLTENQPDLQNQEYTVTFLDNLDEIIQRVKALSDKTLLLDSKYSLPEKLPELSLNADTNTFDKIRELLENPLVVSVQLSDGLEKLNSMFADVSLASPEMAAVPHYTDEIRRIGEIKNTYSTTTNNFYSDTENNTYDTRKSYASDSSGNYITVQNMTISVPNWNINSPADMDDLADALIDRLADRLHAMAVFDDRSKGGAGWTT